MFMSDKKSSRKFIAEIYSETADIFQKQVSERGTKQKAAISAAMRLWAELPVEIQARLLDQSLNGSAFIELVNQVIDERISSKKKTSLKKG
jgi:hypothetical protein